MNLQNKNRVLFGQNTYRVVILFPQDIERFTQFLNLLLSGSNTNSIENMIMRKDIVVIYERRI